MNSVRHIEAHVRRESLALTSSRGKRDWAQRLHQGIADMHVYVISCLRKTDDLQTHLVAWESLDQAYDGLLQVLHKRRASIADAEAFAQAADRLLDYKLLCYRRAQELRDQIECRKNPDLQGLFPPMS